MQFLPNLLRSMRQITDKSCSRYALGALYVERHADCHPTAVATDGRILVACEWPDAESRAALTTLIPQDGLRADKGAVSVAMDEANVNGHIPLTIKPKRGPAALVNVETQEGRFPRWRDCIPDFSQEATTTIFLSPSDLVRLATVFAELATQNEKESIAVTFSHNHEKPVIFSADRDGRKMVGVVMPFGADNIGKTPAQRWNGLPTSLPPAEPSEAPEAIAEPIAEAPELVAAAAHPDDVMPF